MPTRTDWQPRTGDVLLVDFALTRGTEQSGVRPALVVSHPEMNRLTRRAIVCPITRNTAPWPTKVFLPSDAVVRGAVLVDQVRAIDKESRILRPLGSVPAHVLAEVQGKLRTLLGFLPADLDGCPEDAS